MSSDNECSIVEAKRLSRPFDQSFGAPATSIIVYEALTRRRRASQLP